MVYDEIAAVLVAIAFGVFLVFLAMAMQFESPRFSIMVMVSIPFSLIGSAIMLFVTHSILSLISLIGVMTLVGTVVNNGILFVDTANQLKRDMPVREALVESGAIRLRPILTTTLTTIIAMVPMAFERSGNAGMMSGLAIVVMGGLTTSTLLILLFMPTFYLLVAGKKADTLGLDSKALELLKSAAKADKDDPARV
jgi:HAE1 family hydrophobic/amphiphilic exporter-1